MSLRDIIVREWKGLECAAVELGTGRVDQLLGASDVLVSNPDQSPELVLTHPVKMLLDAVVAHDMQV